MNFEPLQHEIDALEFYQELAKTADDMEIRKEALRLHYENKGDRFILHPQLLGSGTDRATVDRRGWFSSPEVALKGWGEKRVWRQPDQRARPRPRTRRSTTARPCPGLQTPFSSGPGTCTPASVAQLPPAPSVITLKLPSVSSTTASMPSSAASP